MKLLICTFCLISFVTPNPSKAIHHLLTDKEIANTLSKSEILSKEELFLSLSEKEEFNKDSAGIRAETSPIALPPKFPRFNPHSPDTIRLAATGAISSKKSLNEIVIKNNFTKNLLGYFITSQHTTLIKSGVQSVSLFKQFSGKRISSIRFVRLHPFGTSIKDTTLNETRWIDKAGNRLHMNTARSKLRMQLLFKAGDTVDPLLMAENEKLMRDLSYLEDVRFTLEPVESNPEEVKVVIIVKDKFEYGVDLSISPDNSNIEVVNENMFGYGHRFNIGMAQKNEYLPEMGLYLSYHVNNILGRFINSTIGYSDTYLKKGWNISLERNFLTSKDVNAGGFSFDHVSKYNFIADDHPIKLDTTISYVSSDIWFSHAFSNKKRLSNNTLISFRYYHQNFNSNDYKPFEESVFLRNHDFILSSVGFSRRNLYQNNLVYGYGVTEDIPYGYYHEITAGLDKSQFGVWPYWKLSFSRAYIGKEGGYYSGRLSVDGFLVDSAVKQGTILLNGNFFSKKFYAFGDPVREFVKIEFLGGINRFKEEYLTIDGRFGIRDFYARNLRGNRRLKINLETVRYLNWNVYGFKFANYYFSDFAFLSDKAESIFKQNFYAGVGVGFRIYNESLVFKIFDIRLTWFPVLPPEGMSSFGANLQGLTKSRFDDYLGRKTEFIRYQ